MKHTTLFTRSILPITLIGSLSASAESWFLQPPPGESPNRFGASFRMAFNVDVDFNNVGAFTPLGTPRLTPDGDAYNYDDGYVLTDSSGNLADFTRYWGYDYDSGPFNQLPGNATIVMHQNSSAGVTAHGYADELQPGVELTYSRALGGNDNWRWGIEAAANYMNVGVRDSRSPSITVARDGYAFPLPPLEGGGFVNPPPAPYQGRYERELTGNALIGDTRAPAGATTMMATVSGSRKFEANIIGFRLGPYLEVPLGQGLMLTVSGGLSLADVNSDFKFNETVAFPGVAPVAGSGSHDEWLLGWHLAGNLSYQLNEAWGLFGGVQYQDVGKYSHKESGREAVLDLSKTMFVVIGASYSF
jgi:opacity protein-like surface antigen